MPLLLGYLSSLNESNISHITKAFYALENFLENLGKNVWRSLNGTKLNHSVEVFRRPF